MARRRHLRRDHPLKRWLAAATVATVVLTATGCDSYNDEHGMGDAPVATATTGRRGGDDTPATCTNMPDGFSNVCTKCVAGAKPWRVIITTHTDTAPSAMGLVQDPKACGGDWVPGPKTVMGTTPSGATPPDDDG